MATSTGTTPKRLAKVVKVFEDPGFEANVEERYGVVCDVFELPADVAAQFNLVPDTPCARTYFLGNKPKKHHDEAPELYDWYQWSEFIKWAVFDAPHLPASDFYANSSASMEED